jgi:hypothetical protein
MKLGISCSGIEGPIGKFFQGNLANSLENYQLHYWTSVTSGYVDLKRHFIECEIEIQLSDDQGNQPLKIHIQIEIRMLF